MMLFLRIIFFSIFFQLIPRAYLVEEDEYVGAAITVNKNSTESATNDTSDSIVGNLFDEIKIATQTKISKAKLEEIEKVRNELKGSLGSEELKVTDKQLKDAQAIRDAISKAVAMDDIVVAVPQLRNNSKHDNKTKATTFNHLDPFLANIKDSRLLDNLLTKEKLEIIVNTIESSIARELEELDNDMPSNFEEHFHHDTSAMWHSNLPQNGRTYREVLQLNSVRENFKFKLGNNVIVWKMLYKKSFGRHTLIGRTDSDIILVSEKDEDYKLLKKIEFSETITGMDVFVRWDDLKMTSENIVVLSIKNQIVLFKLTENSESLEEIWRWNVNKEILMVHYFRMDNSDMVILVTESNTEYSKASADIYEVDISAKEFWIIQIIYLSVPCDNIATLDTGRDYLLSFPQNGTVFVYQFKIEVHGRGRFAPFLNISSDGVTSVSGFQMGGHSYLAIGGYNPQVLRYHRGKLHPQTILSSSFGFVEQYMPISARTYRDDLLLLVQHRIYFETHSLSVLEALIWNGEAFNSALSIPCYIDDVLVNFGITCMIDFERKQGIYGATVIQRGRNISLIVPRQDAPSGLFNLNLTLTQVNSPLSIEVTEVKNLYDSIVKYLNYENEIIASAVDSIENFAPPDKKNKFTGTWNVDTIYTKELQITNKVLIDPPEIHVGDKLWTQKDGHISIDILEIALSEQKHKLNLIEDFIQKQRTRSIVHDTNTPIHTFQPIQTNGRFNIEGIHVLPSEPIYKKKNKVSKRSIQISGTVHAKNVIVSNMNVALINDIAADELVFCDRDLDFFDTLTVNGFLKCENVFLPDGGLVNNMDLSEQIARVNSNSLIDSVAQFEEVHVEENTQISGLVNGVPIDETRLISTDENTDKLNEFPEFLSDLEINGKLTFETINGIEWSSFIRNILMTNLPIHLNELEVHGDVIFDAPLEINTLNELVFPNDFVWVRGPRESIIRGIKHFNSELKTFAIDCHGTINGFDPFSFITLDSSQFIPGEITFHHIEVLESLEINGTVSGKHLNDFMENPTLIHTNHVEAACNFRSLEVEGDIIVQNKMDDFFLDDVLSDVVYYNEPHTVINSFKTFDKATFANELEVTSNLINGINLKDFVTLDTEQELFINKISGNVMFNHLNLKGLFDFINVTELDENSIKILGDQYTETELIFAPSIDSEESYDVYADNIVINAAINGISVDDYVSKDDEIELTGEFSFEDILVEEFIYETGNINTNDGLVNDVNLQLFDEKRMSINKPQTIKGVFYTEEVHINGKVYAAVVNDHKMENVNYELDQSLNIRNILATEDVYIENLYVEDSVACNNVNGHDFQNINENAIWLNKTNTIYGIMRFLDPIVIKGNITVEGQLNTKPFDDFIESLVFKTDDNIVIRGDKFFAQGFTVTGDLNVEQIDNVPVQHLLTRFTTDIFGNITVNGNVHITKPVTLDGNLNDVPMKYLENVYKHDAETKSHILKDNFIINEPVHVDHVQFNGYLNEIQDVNLFLKSILLKNQNMNLTNEFIFTGLVHFANGFNVDLMNGINFNEFSKDIVLINNPTPTLIYNDVYFQAPIAFKEVLVTGNIHTNIISGCFIDEWMDYGIRIDQPILINSTTYFAPGTLNVANLKVVYLNKNPMGNVITLNTDQYIEDDIICNEMFSPNPIQVDGFINGLKLNMERENTLMTYGDQFITIPTTFQNVRVLDSLLFNGLVNKINISNLATLDSDIYLRSPLSFMNITVNNLITKDTISGIDFDEWYQNALWRTGREYQTITGNWTIENICVPELTGNEILNNETITTIINNMENNQREVDSNIKVYNEDFHKLCYEINDLVEKSQHQIYYFEYFESFLNIYEKSPISTSLFFQFGNEIYIVVSQDCFSSVYTVIHDDYQLIHHFETGFVKQWINVRDTNGYNYLVSNTGGNLSNNCAYSGTLIWLFNGTSISFVRKVGEYNDFSSLHIISDEYGIFYTLNSESNIVYKFDILGKLIEEWVLPYEGTKYRFVPHELTLSLAVSDGKKLSILSSVQRQKIVKKRYDYMPKADNGNERIKRHFSKALIEKLSNVTSALKKSTKPKALDRDSLLGKSKLIDLTQKRKIKNGYLANEEEAATINDDLLNNSTNDFQTTDLNSKTSEQTLFMNVLKYETTTPMTSVGNETLNSSEESNFNKAYDITISPTTNYVIENETTTTISTFTSKPITTTTSKEYDTTKIVQSKNIALTKTSSEVEESLTSKFMSALNLFFTGDSENNLTDARTVTLNDYKYDDITSAKPKIDKSIDFQHTTSESILKIKDVTATTESPLKQVTYDFDVRDDETKNIIISQDLTTRTIESTIENNKFIDTTKENIPLDDLKTNTPSSDIFTTVPAIVDKEKFDSTFVTENAKINQNDIQVATTQKMITTTIKHEDSYISKSIETSEKEGTKQNDKINEFVYTEPASQKSTVSGKITTEPALGEKIFSSYQSKSKVTTNNYGYTQEGYTYTSPLVREDLQPPLNKIPKTDYQIVDATQSIHATSTPLDSYTSKYTILTLPTTNNPPASLPMAEKGEEITTENSRLKEIYYRRFTMSASEIDALQKSTDIERSTTPISYMPTIVSTKIDDTTDYSIYPLNTQKKSHLIVNNKKYIDESYMPIISRVPFIIIPKNEANISEILVAETTTSLNARESVTSTDDILIEPNIAQEIPLGGILTANNEFIPERDHGDIVVLKVGSIANKKTLVAVSSSKKSTIPGKHDVIQIYEDILEGKLFQTLPCYKPSGLVIMNIGDETLLAFLEGENKVQIFTYKGIQGFSPLTQHKLHSSATNMAVLNYRVSSKCTRYFLAITMNHEIELLEAKVNGNCGVSSKTDCK